MKIILAFDSFKGSLSAEEAVRTASKGILTIMPDAEIIGLPLADGGEGFSETLHLYTNAEKHYCKAHDALMREIEATYYISQDGETAIIDMASAAGLTLIEEDKRNPMFTTTYGVGEMILNAVNYGCKQILLGIGGSATNDGGIGMLAALGVSFFDKNGDTLPPIGKKLNEIARIDWSGLKISNVTQNEDSEFVGQKPIRITVACDVENPLFGTNGAAHVYARQKGATEEDVITLDNGLRHFSTLCHPISTNCNHNITPATLPNLNPDSPGAGAAGGLGFGLMLLNAKLCKGYDIILDASDFEKHLVGTNLVLTGEGKTDCQTLQGKLPYGVLKRAKTANVPVIIVSGIVENKEELIKAGFKDAVSINPPLLSVQDLHEAMKPENAMRNLELTCQSLLSTSQNF